MIPFELSDLKHTWIIDIDGTIFKHNGYKDDGEDVLLPGVLKFWDTIPKDDVVILMTGRPPAFERMTVGTLKKYNIWYDYILFGVGIGERIVINDIKPQGLKTAIAWNVERDKGFIS